MKCIALIRTSTVKQEVESQRKEVVAFAKSKGYGKDDIIVIGGSGASAIKLDDEYLSNINQVYKTIEQGGVDAVFAFAIDRIGRDEEVLMQFKNTLIKNKVNLYIQNPALTLLNEDGTVNNGVELAFSLFSTMSKQEMITKKARFDRARKRNREQGRFQGGKVTLGYMLDDDNRFILHPANSQIVRDIFDEYLNQPISTRALARKYCELGVFKSKTPKAQEHSVQHLLKNRSYTGVHPYPQIVDERVFELVQKKLADFRIHPKVKYKETTYYLQGIIKDITVDPDTGEIEVRPMRVKKSEVSYVSYFEHFSVNINTIDSAVLYVVNKVLAEFDSTAIERQNRETRKRLQNKITSIKSQMELKRNKLDELNDRYFAGESISPATYERNKRKLELDLEALSDDLKTAQGNLSRTDGFAFERVDLYSLDDQQRREVIMKYVEVVYAQKTGTYTAEIDVCFRSQIGISYKFTYDRKAKTMTRYYNDKDGNPEAEIVQIPVVRDIKGRKRNYKGSKSGVQLDVQG